MNNIIIYDFDGTLTPYPVPKYNILEKCGIKNGIANLKFLKLAYEKTIVKNIDFYQAIYETYLEIVKDAGYKLIDDNFILGSNKVVYNNGVTYFLEMLSKNNIDNYLLSSGIKVYLDNTSISSYFKDIYATTFCYDNDEITGIDFLMSDKNKVIAIKDILNKHGQSVYNCSNIIYIGDGLTDYYAMEYIKKHGGTSIFVYKNPNSKDVLAMKQKDVVTIYTKANFSENSNLDRYVKKICKIKKTN